MTRNLTETLTGEVTARLRLTGHDRAWLADQVSVSLTHLSGVLDGDRLGSLHLWGRMLTAVGGRLATVAAEPLDEDGTTAGPWEVCTTLDAEDFVVQAGRGLFGMVATPARGTADYGRANAALIVHCVNGVRDGTYVHVDRLGAVLEAIEAEQVSSSARLDAASQGRVGGLEAAAATIRTLMDTER